jgi:hypothetical protein
MKAGYRSIGALPRGMARTLSAGMALLTHVEYEKTASIWLYMDCGVRILVPVNILSTADQLILFGDHRYTRST